MYRTHTHLGEIPRSQGEGLPMFYCSAGLPGSGRLLTRSVMQSPGQSWVKWPLRGGPSRGPSETSGSRFHVHSAPFPAVPSCTQVSLGTEQVSKVPRSRGPAVGHAACWIDAVLTSLQRGLQQFFGVTWCLKQACDVNGMGVLRPTVQIEQGESNTFSVSHGLPAKK